MTAQELILIEKRKVRSNPDLMSLYLVYFQEAYGYRPSCAGCSFATDWQKIVSFYSNKQEKTLNLQKEIFMEIKIKKIQGKILSYKKDGKTFRLYDNILNPEFIDGYLKNGTKEELAERKKLFNFPVVVLNGIEVSDKDLETGKKIVDSLLKNIQPTPKKRGRKTKE